MIGVIRLNKAVFRKLISLTGIEKILIGAEERWLVFQKIDNLERRACLVEVVEPGCMACCHNSFIDTLVLLIPVEDVHADLTKGCAVVGKSPVTQSRSGNRGKPAIEDGELCCQSAEGGQLIWGEVVEDQVGVVHTMVLIKVAFDEALHGRLAIGILGWCDPAEDL